MRPEVDLLILITWTAIPLVWAASYLNRKRTVRSEPVRSRSRHVLVLGIAFLLLFSSTASASPLAWRVMPRSRVATVVGLGLTLGGVAFAILGRLRLGGNWSSRVTLKEDHSLVRSGPYGIVRHPIYAGLLLAMFGTALTLGELRGLLAVVLALGTWVSNRGPKSLSSRRNSARPTRAIDVR